LLLYGIQVIELFSLLCLGQWTSRGVQSDTNQVDQEEDNRLAKKIALDVEQITMGLPDGVPWVN
jgi:hypothetical protein